MAKKENTSAAAKVAKAEKQAAKGAEDSKLTSAQKVAKAEKSKAKAAKPKNPNGNIFQRFVKGFKKFWKDFRGEIKKITWPGAKTVLKNTGVVLVSVAVVGVVMPSTRVCLSSYPSLLSLPRRPARTRKLPPRS